MTTKDTPEDVAEAIRHCTVMVEAAKQIAKEAYFSFEFKKVETLIRAASEAERLRAKNEDLELTTRELRCRIAEIDGVEMVWNTNLDEAPRDGTELIFWISSEKGFPDQTSNFYWWTHIDNDFYGDIPAGWQWSDSNEPLKRPDLVKGWMKYPQPTAQSARRRFTSERVF